MVVEGVLLLLLLLLLLLFGMGACGWSGCVEVGAFLEGAPGVGVGVGLFRPPCFFARCGASYRRAAVPRSVPTRCS